MSIEKRKVDEDYERVERKQECEKRTKEKMEESSKESELKRLNERPGKN